MMHLFNKKAIKKIIRSSCLIYLFYLFPVLAFSQGTDGQALTLNKLILPIALLLLLAYLFYMVFKWWQRNEQASYLGKIFQESVFEFELSRRIRRTEEKYSQSQYRLKVLSSEKWRDKTRPVEPVPEKELLAIFHSAQSYEQSSAGIGGTRRPRSMRNDPWGSTEPGYTFPLRTNIPDDLKPKYDEFLEKLNQFEEARRNWDRDLEKAIEELYQNDITNARIEAEKQADRAADVDMGVFRGRGASFVLEFTAVVVIVFIAAVLALLGNLGQEQVGTLLAAIAGYVLGRSISSSEQKPTSGNQNNGEARAVVQGNKSREEKEENKIPT